MDSILYNYTDFTDIDFLEDTWTLLIEDIESYCKKHGIYILSQCGHFEIDRIQMLIHIKKQFTKYHYVLYARNFYYITETASGDNLCDIYKSCEFSTVLELLDNLKEVKHNYIFFDNILCSPKHQVKLKKLKYSLAQPDNNKENECSICYQPTKQVTVCNHPICLHCRESCILLQREKCPICRGSKLYHYPYDPLFFL